MDKEKREFWVTLIGILLFVGVVGSFQNDAKSFQAYLEGSSPTAHVVSFEEAIDVAGVNEETETTPIVVPPIEPKIVKPKKRFTKMQSSRVFGKNTGVKNYLGDKKEFANALRKMVSGLVTTQDFEDIFSTGKSIPAEETHQSFANALRRAANS